MSFPHTYPRECDHFFSCHVGRLVFPSSPPGSRPLSWLGAFPRSRRPRHSPVANNLCTRPSRPARSAPIRGGPADGIFIGGRLSFRFPPSSIRARVTPDVAQLYVTRQSLSPLPCYSPGSSFTKGVFSPPTPIDHLRFPSTTSALLVLTLPFFAQVGFPFSGSSPPMTTHPIYHLG